MKDRIIDASIQSLRQEGLRFSVDVLAERLRISKKTIYKYFPTKEALAYAMYARYYEKLQERIRTLVQHGGNTREQELLLCYLDSAKMISREIFNKYSLNQVIGDFAADGHAAVWKAIRPCVCGGMTDEEAEIYQLIVDGALERTIAREADPAAVIGMLRRIK
ncbi:MAG: TetR/AcrR family transcriptional regulator [Hominenteromicrobium sp.]